MLRVTSYQEALRAIGALADRPHPSATPPLRGETRAVPTCHLRLEEDDQSGMLALTLDGERRELTARDLRDLVTEARANRGLDGSYGGPTSDLLRALGSGLDDLGARQLCLELAPTGLLVRYQRNGGTAHEIAYSGDDLAALRTTATARRKGDPLSRVLILHDDAAAAAPLRELLVAEFAVEALSGSYAEAIAQANHQPHLVIVHLSGEVGSALMLQTIRTLRASTQTGHIPIVVVTAPGCPVDPMAAFAAGADDLVPEPFAPPQIRARLRTWLLRGAVAA